jgi:hypothetical protein
MNLETAVESQRKRPTVGFGISESLRFVTGHDFTGCEKLLRGLKKRQGTTSVVPQMPEIKGGL